MPASTASPANGPLLMDASSAFEAFVHANSLKHIQQLFYQICLLTGVNPSLDHSKVYNVIRGIDRGKANSKAQKLFALLDKRKAMSVYEGQKVCKNMNVLVVGAGPCGLRAAIECALLGAKVVVVECRDSFSRNNVLHLWEFVIQDLKALGAKIFYPKFCTGSIEHISIRQLQCILMKVALVLGVEVYEEVGYVQTIEPSKDGQIGWRSKFTPAGHILENFEHDVVIGADGKKRALPYYPRNTIRGKMAIGITANFINTKSAAEEKVSEIQGVAYIFNQDFFKRMSEKTGIDLENIVYYKDDTHYFVMCAKKASLIQKGVIKKETYDEDTLLKPENIDYELLYKYALQAADFATNQQLPQLDFAMNHKDEPDVAVFDFTSLQTAMHTTKFFERHGRCYVETIVGDSLHEPFWPTGSGCARGFLGVFDAAWMIKNFGINEKPPVAIIGERENVFKLLAQSCKSNLSKAYHRYSIDPTSRYTSVPRGVELADVAAEQLYTDNQTHRLTDFYLSPWGIQRNDADLKRKCALLRLCAAITTKCHVNVFNFGASNWSDGIALGALIACFRPDLIDFEHVKQFKGTDDLIDRLFDVLKEHYGVARPCDTMQEWVNMTDEHRYDYVEEVVAALKHETNSCLMMSPGLKSTILSSRKRSKVYKYDPSRVKVSEQITRKADILLNAMVNSGVIQEEEQPESKQPRQTLTRVPSVKEVRTAIPEPEPQMKHYTPRPVVDRLNPEKVCFVEQVVKGNYDADRRKAMYDEKYRAAEAKTQKMEKAVIEKMEQKLEDTVQGTLSERNRPVDSLEEKIMRENASKARLIARGEFRSCLDDKFKEIDERIAKAENTLKFSDLAGVHAVTGGRPAEPTHSKPIPPPTPPKPSMVPSSSLDDDRENVNGRDVVFRAPGAPGKPASRPQSSPNDLYASVLAHRKNICALCNTQVFLAEKMDIDKVMIHKRCFKCSYCQQPLRIGNCTLDRALMDEWGRRWYCQQHIGLRHVDKVARLQKNGKTSARTSVAVVTPTPAIRPPMVAGDRPSDSSKDSSTTSSSLYTEGYKSPASFTARTINRMKERIAQVATMGTPEHSEFAISRVPTVTNAGPSSLTVRPSMGAIASLGSPRLPRASASIVEVPEEAADFEVVEAPSKDTITPGPSGDDYHKHVLEPQSSSEISTLLDEDTDSTEHSLETAESEEASNTDDDSDEAEMWNEFNEVLENTLTKAIDPKTTPNVSEEQASKWIETFNKRKSFLNIMRSPKSVYSTPAPNFTPKRVDEFYTPMSTPVTTRPGRAALGNGTSAYSTVVNGDDLFENMPSMQRNKAASSSPPDSEFVTPKVSFNDAVPRIGASESGKESGMKARLRSLRSSRANVERRKTVALEPFSSSGPALSMYAEKKERELTAHAEAFEEKEEQQSRVQSGTTTTIEIAPSSSSSSSQMETPKRLNYVSRSAEARRLRAKTLTNGINKDDLQVAMESVPPAIAPSPQNIARVQKQVGKILRKQEAERQRTEQDVQRALDETEHRIQEVTVVGTELEDGLGKAPQNSWLLENWLLYVQEYVQLRLKEEDLHRQVRSISLSQKYQMLKAQLMEEGEDKVEKDKSLMKQMIDTLDEIQQLHTETSKNIRKSTMFDIPQLLDDKQNDFNNFGPVFKASGRLNYDIFLY